MRGRKPKPTRLKVLRGETRPSKLKTEPKVDGPIELAPPDHLGEAAAAEYRRIAQKMADSGLLTTLDRGTLAAYCDCYGTWVECCVVLRIKGVTLVNMQGNTVARPEVALRNESLRQMRGYLAELGLSPASRTRVGVQLNEDN